MDGFEAARRIRGGAVPGAERLPIVALTVNGLPDDEERCLACGMDAFVGMPLHVPDLVRLLDEHLARRARQRAG